MRKWRRGAVRRTTAGRAVPSRTASAVEMVLDVWSKVVVEQKTGGREREEA